MGEERVLSASLEVEVPQKPSFKIGEVAHLLNEEPYTLRYWESEFEEVEPERTPSGQRLYRREDVEMLVRIKTLLHVEGYTLAGARRQLELDPSGAGRSVVDAEAARLLEQRLSAKEGELAELADQLAVARVEHEARKAQCDSLEAKLEAAYAQIEAQRIQMESFEVQSAAHEGVDERWAAMTEQLHDQLARLERDLQEYRHQLATVTQERDGLEQQCDELSARLRHSAQARRQLVGALEREVRGLAQI